MGVNKNLKILQIIARKFLSKPEKKIVQISTVTLLRLSVNLWKIICEIYKKIDKMSISDWGTVEKMRQKLEKVLVLSNICCNFENRWENL